MEVLLCDFSYLSRLKQMGDSQRHIFAASTNSMVPNAFYHAYRVSIVQMICMLASKTCRPILFTNHMYSTNPVVQVTTSRLHVKQFHLSDVSPKQMTIQGTINETEPSVRNSYVPTRPPQIRIEPENHGYEIISFSEADGNVRVCSMNLQCMELCMQMVSQSTGLCKFH